jgi:hypothetical protein
MEVFVNQELKRMCNEEATMSYRMEVTEGGWEVVYWMNMARGRKQREGELLCKL